MKPEKNVVVITGAGGRIGSAAMQRLRERFYPAVGFDWKAPEPPPQNWTRIALDVTSDASVEQGLRILREHHGLHITAVLHLAAYYDFLGKPSPLYDRITVEGTARLPRGLQAGGFKS